MVWDFFTGPQQPGKHVGIASAAFQLPRNLSVKARGELWLQASSNFPGTRVAGKLRDHGAAVAAQTTLALPSDSIPGLVSVLLWVSVLCRRVWGGLLGALLAHGVTAAEIVAIPGLPGTFLV